MCVVFRFIETIGSTQTRDKFAQSGDEPVGLAVLHSDETTIRTPPLSQTGEHTFFSPQVKSIRVSRGVFFVES